MTATLKSALAVAASLALGGCAAAGNPPLATEGIVSNDGTYFVAFETIPDPVPVNAEFEVEAVVLDAATRSRAMADVDLAVDASMPDHGHGMNVVPRVERLKGGRFRAVGLMFHMPGLWELDFDVTRGAVTERAQAAIEID